jgi:hypothetical protein
MSKTPNEVLIRAQQFAANVAICNDDKDWWHILRMEAERVRDELHVLRSETKETVVVKIPTTTLPDIDLDECEACGSHRLAGAHDSYTCLTCGFDKETDGQA